MNYEKHRPAKPSWVAVFLAVAAIFTLTFFAVLRFDLNRVKKLDVDSNQIMEASAVQLEYEINATQTNGAVQFTGWNFMKDRPFKDVNNYVVLYNSTENQYLQLPTLMQPSEYLQQTYPEDDYAPGGFYSLVHSKYLSQDYSDYILCFKMSSQNENYDYIIKTDKTLQEVLA